MSKTNITNGILLDCEVFKESIGVDKDLILINYDDFDLEQTSSIFNRQNNSSLSNYGGLLDIFLKPGGVQHIFEGTDYSVVPTITPEVREDGSLWYTHSISFTVYSKKASDRETLLTLSKSIVIAVTKERSTGLYELFGMYQGLKVSGIERAYTGSQNSNFYQVTIATPEINVIKEPSLSELSLNLDGGTVLPPAPIPGVYGDATPTVQGLVRVDSVEPNPIVYLKTTIDSLFSRKSNMVTTSTEVEANKTSTEKFPALKAIVDWITERFEPLLSPSDTTKWYRGDKQWIEITKETVGLGNVDNTADVDKPIPDAVISALANKADLIGGKVDPNQLPSYVSDVLEFADLANFPTIGIPNTIYVAINPSNFQYRWSGSTYIQITSGGLASTDDLPEGSNNLYFTVTRFLQNLTPTRILDALGFTPEDSSNKQNSLTPDGTGTKFPTVDAVNGLLNILTPEAYVKKEEGWDLVADYGALLVINQLGIIDNRSSVSLVGLATDVKSLQFNLEFVRTGKPFYFKNRTNHDVTLWHLSGTGNHKFFFPDGQNLVVKPGEVIFFNLNNNDTSDNRVELVGTPGSATGPSASNFIPEPFIYISGAKEFTTANPIAQVLLVFRNGKQIYNYTNTTTLVTISSDLVENDEVLIVYSSEPVGTNPYYTKTQSEGIFAKIINSVLKGFKTSIESNNIDLNPNTSEPNIFAPGVTENLIHGKGNTVSRNKNRGFGNNNQFNDGGDDFAYGDRNQFNKSKSFYIADDCQSNADRDTVVGRKYQSNIDDSFTVAYNDTLSDEFLFRVSEDFGVEFGELKGVGHSLIQTNSEGRLIDKGNRLVYINTKQDLLDNGTKVGNVITLRTLTSYCLLGSIDLTGDRLVIENSSIFSFSPTTGALTSTGLGGSQFLVTPKKVCSFDRFVLFGNGTQFGIDISDPTATIIINLMTFVDLLIGLYVNSASNILVTASSFQDSEVLFTGTVEYISISKTIFVNNPTGSLYLLNFNSGFICTNRVVIEGNRIIQNNSGGFSMNLDVAMTAGTETIQLKDNVFTGAVTAIAGINSKDNRANFKDNIGIPNGAVIGNYYNISNALATDIVTTNVPVKVNSSATTVTAITNKFTHISNRLTYVGALSKDFIVNATASVTGTNGHLLGFYIAKNGTVLPETFQPISIGATNRAENVKIQGALSLSNGDFIELWVVNVNNNADVTVTAFNVLIEAKN